MAPSQTHFQNAHGITINGGQFLNIGHANRMIIKGTSDSDPGTWWLHIDDDLTHPDVQFRQTFGNMWLLEQYSILRSGFLLQSAIRALERMIEKIVDWIDNPSPSHRILWLYGPAGAGKSALARTICERRKDRCGGSFFFARGPTDRGRAFKLFVTLSYQLALQFPAFREALNKALYHDPSLPTKSMEAQLYSLIIQPLLRCTSFPNFFPVLIIDGLDECADDQGMDTQRHIIALISQSIVEHDIPLRFLIASRPESWIRDIFESSPLPSITPSLSLREDIDADKDIRAYLTEEFEKIRVENKRIMGSVPSPWPPTNIVNRFVYEASGHYIYASTLLRFVGNSSKFNDPQAQLRILTSLGPHRALAFSELDRLYERILSAYPRWATMKRVLGGILADANSTIIEKILGVDPTELILVLDALSPLIDLEMPRPPSEHERLLVPIYGCLETGHEQISLCHLSFREFLEDETRSGAFHIDIRGIAEEITRAFFGNIHRNIDQNYANEPHVFMNMGLGTYQHMMSVMAYQCLQWMRNSDLDTLCQLVIATTHKLLLLLNTDLDMEFFGCFIADMEWLDTVFIEPSNWLDSAATQCHQCFNQDQVNAYVRAALEFEDAVSLGRNRCIHLLSSYERFRVTPTLAYLHEFHGDRTAFVDTIFKIGYTAADVLSTLHNHRHTIDIVYNHIQRRWALSILSLNNLQVPAVDEDGGWRTRGEWRHQRISVMGQILDIILNVAGGYAGFVVPILYDEWDQDLFCHLGGFFESRNLSDIQTKKYFQNPCNLSILGLMTDFSVRVNWLTLKKEKWDELAHFIVPVLCWFNRQLTNSTTLNLLDDHDKNLGPNMRKTMNQIFEQLFLPNYSRSYHSALSVSVGNGTHVVSFKIKVLPLPQGCYLERTAYVRHEYPDSSYWRQFHDEVFGKTLRTQEGHPTIDHLRWHPYLASYLLDSLAKDSFTHGPNNPTFDQYVGGHFGEQTEESFAYIVECLPYAETTQQNLDSLRAIAYLFTDAKLEWDPPIEFWFLSMEFLKKYDRSILSEEELSVFEGWMLNMSCSNPSATEKPQAQGLP